jgi:hypothetical protein
MLCISIRALARLIGKFSPVLPVLSLSQTIIQLPEFQSQPRGMEYILPMGIQNNWGNKMVAEDHQIQPSSSYFENANSTSSNNNRCLPNSMGSDFSICRTEHKDKRKKRDKKIIPRKKESNNIIGKRKNIMPNKLRGYKMEL